MDASVQRCRLLDLGPICVMQCSSECSELSLQSRSPPSLRNVLSHHSRSAYVICNNVLEIRSNLKSGKNSWPSRQLHH